MADESAFRAVAHPVRRRMLDMLRRRELAVGELVQPFRLSRPSISQHLRVLRTSGLVTQKRRGRTRMYALDGPRLRAIFEWVSEFEPSWSRRASRASAE